MLAESAAIDLINLSSFLRGSSLNAQISTARSRNRLRDCSNALGEYVAPSVTREAFQRLKDALVLSMLETSTLAIVGNRMNARIATNSIQENRARVFRNPNEL
jgi:hypothetical protein